MTEDKDLRRTYNDALDQFIERVKQDNSILAVYVLGSYVNGTLWERSDIDTIIVTNDERTSGRFFVLLENDVCIQAFSYSRSDFRRDQRSFIHGSILHHLLATSKLIYSTDKA
ncbi:MAG: nucleotidyltransferase domain-containing protein, partial [Candidatus Hodarchaeota archaeon]